MLHAHPEPLRGAGRNPPRPPLGDLAAAVARAEAIVSRLRRLVEDREDLGLDAARARALLRRAEGHLARLEEKRRRLRVL
jgi:hypothetical protein